MLQPGSRSVRSRSLQSMERTEKNSRPSDLIGSLWKNMASSKKKLKKEAEKRKLKGDDWSSFRSLFGSPTGSGAEALGLD